MGDPDRMQHWFAWRIVSHPNPGQQSASLWQTLKQLPESGIPPVEPDEVAEPELKPVPPLEHPASDSPINSPKKPPPWAARETLLAMRAAAFLEVLLVVLLGAPEVVCVFDARGNRFPEGARLFEPLHRGLRGALLSRVLGEDRRTVLGADVRSLAIHLGGVVVRE